MARPRLRTLGLALVVVGVLAIVAVLYVTRDKGLPAPDPPAALESDAPDPFSWADDRRANLERRATAGFAHVVYAKSPGGAPATAPRVARYRRQIESVARSSGIPADTIEAIVFLESAGRPDAVADPKLEGAVGLTQILAETGRNLLGMRVDPVRARKLTRRINRAAARGDSAGADRLRARRRAVDQRFDPGASLRATARYLGIAKAKLGGRDDYAVAGYHMGIGNLQSVIADFGRDGDAPGSYAEVYFASTPYNHAAAYRRLSGLGDDSSTYLWRIRASAAIMRLHRDNPGALARSASLQTAKNSAEEVLHPRDSTTVFADPDALAGAYRDHSIRSFPNAPRQLGLRRGLQMGELGRKLKEPRRLYRGLRPEAYALAAYAVRLTRQAGGPNRPLTVTSTVRDQKYQRLLVGRNREATQSYSLHTTGYAFDVLRRYASRRQALAFQFTLDRLQALNLIAWVREPAAIHITASSDAKVLVPLLKEKG